MHTRTLFLVSLSMAPGCGGDKDDTGTTPSDEGDADTDSDTDADADADADADTDSDADTDTAVVLDCPTPVLGVYRVGYERFIDKDTGGRHPEVYLRLLLSAGFTDDGDPGCFTTGTALYDDSRIDLSIPGGKVVLSLPRDYLASPSNLEIGPLREDDKDPTLHFGDLLDTNELAGDLPLVIATNPVLDGFARLCNANGECDELAFTFEEVVKK